MVKEKFELFKKAYEKLNASLESNIKDELIRDGIIQRYEFTFELCWKTIKLYLEEIGIGIFTSPKTVFKEAFKEGIIKNGDIYLDMIEDRNLTVHTYDETIALEIFDNIKNKYIFEFAKLVDFFEEYLK